MDVQPRESRWTRLMGGVLVALWAALAVAIAAAYRPGGPLDIVVVAACFLPVMVASASLVRPPRPRTQRDHVVLVWVWILGVLLGTSLLYSLASVLAADGPQTLVPSAEVAYAAFLAFLCMGGFSLLGIADDGRSAELFSGGFGVRVLALALATATGVALVFGSVLLVNDRNLPLGPALISRHGPTDPALVPPECDEPAALGPNARVIVEARALVDDVVSAEARLTGLRGGFDEAWSGAWQPAPGTDPGGQDGVDASSPGPTAMGMAYRRVGPDAWLNAEDNNLEAAGTTWLAVEPDPFDLVGPGALTMDGPTLDLVGTQRGTIVPEDIGLEVIEGARARHCRTFIDGPTALATFLPLRWLLGGDAVELGNRLEAWRGELDWWVFADGQLGRATVWVSGLGTDAWPDPPGIRGELEATLEATDRARSIDIGGPPG